jgi:hypothetical protein
MTASRRSEKAGDAEKGTASGPEGATPPPLASTGSGKVRGAARGTRSRRCAPRRCAGRGRAGRPGHARRGPAAAAAPPL